MAARAAWPDCGDESIFVSIDSPHAVTPGEGAVPFVPPSEFDYHPDASGIYYAVGSGPPRTSRETVESADPYWYGRRYEYRQNELGVTRLFCVPLTYEDVLFPREDDRISHNQFHGDTTVDFSRILRRVAAGREGMVITWDLLIDFGRPDVKQMAPDTAVLVNVKDAANIGGVFRFAERGGEPLLVVEETSLSTRNQDLYDKVDLYFRAGVLHYLIYDVAVEHRAGEVKMYHRGPRAFVEATPNARGHFPVQELGLEFGLVGREPAIFDANGQRMLPETAVRIAAEQAADKARHDADAARQAADAARQDAAHARQLAEQEAEARRAVEARNRELEERLRMLEGGK